MAASALSLLTARVEALEAEVARLKRQDDGVAEQEKEPKQDWVNLIYGAFADYPDYDKVVDLGRKYRESLRPAATRKKTTRKKTIRNKAPRVAKKRGR
jgi:hypothetical protein